MCSLARNDVRVTDNIGRRGFVEKITATLASSGGLSFFSFPSQARAADNKGSSLAELKSVIQQARSQLEPVPEIIEKQQWDKVRAILITPPLSDLWTTTRRGGNILMDVASAVGDAGGDELNILELREEAQSHLRCTFSFLGFESQKI